MSQSVSRWLIPSDTGVLPTLVSYPLGDILLGGTRGRRLLEKRVRAVEAQARVDSSIRRIFRVTRWSWESSGTHLAANLLSPTNLGGFGYLRATKETMSMLRKVQGGAEYILRQMGGRAARKGDSNRAFHSDEYLRHNARRLEHLASLRIPVSGMSVLEVGAGIGDHSHYYIDRGCSITITDARDENISILKNRYPLSKVEFLDMEFPPEVEGAPFDVVHCYGLLYHLSNPSRALEFLSHSTSGIMLLETCVSFGEEERVYLTRESQSEPTQAYSGIGCRPTRSWLFRELRGLFEHVYVPVTQPCHEEFPIDWTNQAKHTAGLQRAVFVASRERIENELLEPSLVPRQRRHE